MVHVMVVDIPRGYKVMLHMMVNMMVYIMANLV